VVGGLAFSQLITLFVTPVVYTYMDAFSARFRRRRYALDEGLPGDLRVAPAGASYDRYETDKKIASSGTAAD
jgi:hypothetical protein